MNVVSAKDPATRARLRRVGWSAPEAMVASVTQILNAVRERGDAAIGEFARRFDDPAFDVATMRVQIPDQRAAREAVPAAIARAVDIAKDRIERFHERQRQADLSFAAEDGSRYGWHRRPLRAVAAYVPGGAATMPSSLLMAAVPAKLAGVSRLIVLTPPRSGGLPAALLYACASCGVDELYAVGGAQAIAAAAYGTETIAAVDKVVGPGGVWTTEAKRQVFGACGIDGLAGPAEVLVVADEAANSEYVAGELIAQAEHAGATCMAVVSQSRSLLDAVAQLIDSLDVKTLERGWLIGDALERDGMLVHAETADEVFDLIDAFAPATLCLHVRDARDYLPRISRAGTVLVGDSTPLAAGDYVAGTNHVVPTAGTARFCSALSLSDFMRCFSVIENSAERMSADADAVAEWAQLEELPQHARTARMRQGV